MKQASTSITNVRDALSKRPAELWREKILKALAKCALHFRVEMVDADYRIFLEGLRDVVSADRIVVAVERCQRECNYFPRLKEVYERLPELETTNRIPDRKVIKVWTENYLPTADLQFTEYEGGYRQVRWLKKERASEYH